MSAPSIEYFQTILSNNNKFSDELIKKVIRTKEGSIKEYKRRYGNECINRLCKELKLQRS